MWIAGIFTFLVAGGIYQMVKPPPSRRFGSANGPPVTYQMVNPILFHICLPPIFLSSKFGSLVDFNFENDANILESDPNPHRSPKNDALDIKELADQLELGPKFYVVGASMDSYPVWGCLKYIPHRLAGAAFVVPVINYWWPSLPSESCSKAYSKLPLLEQWKLRFIHYTPKLAWSLQRWLTFPTIHTILKDTVIAYGFWDFNPLELTNPYPENSSGSVHLWMGREDGMVAPELSRHVAKTLPWIRTHEVPYGGHLFLHDKNLFEMILKSLVLGENPSFEKS